MKIAVFGAGAIGAFLGARLLEAGREVAFIARGPHLRALRADGLLVESDELGEQRYPVRATDDPSEIGPVDYVILGVKAHALTAIAPACAPLLGPETAVVSLQNGLPWWYFHGIEADETPLESVDPGGAIARNLPPERAIGGVAYISSSLAAPGVLRHTQGVRFPIGEPDNSRSDRVQALFQAFRDGGVKAPIRADIRHEIWVKMMGNSVFNPLSALTRKTMVEMVEFAPTYELMRRAMEEIREVAAATGVQIGFSAGRRLEGARGAGRHKTSMLQDLLAGRATEIEAVTGSVVELARRKNVAVPTLEAVYAAAKLLFA